MGTAVGPGVAMTETSLLELPAEHEPDATAANTSRVVDIRLTSMVFLRS